MAGDYYLLSPSDQPRLTGPREQSAPPQETEAPPAGERRRELPMPPVVYVPCTPGDDGINHLAYGWVARWILATLCRPVSPTSRWRSRPMRRFSPP